MFRGFNLQEIDFDSDYKEKLIEEYENTIEIYNKAQIDEKLDNFLFTDGILDASRIEEEWFPQLKSDIFISHSHKDEKTAKALAMWLSDTFGLNAFIDSTVWGYYTILLDALLKETTIYNASSHVHLMLNQALMKMIDKCETLFFLNTPNSVNVKTAFTTKTYSPWLYSEIGMSHVIRRKKPARYRSVNFAQSQENKNLLLEASMAYEINLTHLTVLDSASLNSWVKNYEKSKTIKKIVDYEFNHLDKEHPLDVLYRDNPLKMKSINS